MELIDTGTAKALTTTTFRGDVYAFFFDQKGLMAGLGLQDSKVKPQRASGQPRSVSP